MSLKNALLGFLNYGSMTGYELKKIFDPSIGHFWNAELSQMYPTLKQLESEGLVEMAVEVQADKPNRKVYSITDDGARELSDWLVQPATPDQVREPLMIKVFFGAAPARRELIAVLRHRADELRRTIEAHEQGRVLIGKFAETFGLDREGFFWDLTVDAGLKHCNAGIEWIEAAIDKIERLDDSFFAAERSRVDAIDVRRAMEMLDKLKAEMPEVFAGPHHPGVNDESR
jgi:DNA-binding PadR family transcriptional regulator